MKLTYKQILEQFKKWKKDATLEDIKWFCAYHFADDLTDHGTKEIARMLDGGNIIGFHSRADVVSQINYWGKKHFKYLLK